ncbi:MAG: hypothetical protein ABFD46_09195 [Armatimonadota bacterium]
MKKLVVVALFMLCLGVTYGAGNATALTSSTPEISSDSAVNTQDILSKKVTYTSGAKRLHVVTEDLSRISGLDIFCGQNKNDWRVRDIPVVVCVKDMPLGKVLKAIADATHTNFISTKVKDGEITRYGIRRTAKSDLNIDQYLKNKHDLMLDAVDWQWDALTKYGKSKEAKGIPGLGKNIWLIAKLIATLDPDAENDLLNGSTISFSGKNPAYQDTIGELYELERNVRHSADMDAAPPATQEDEQSAVLKMKLIDNGDTGESYIETNLSPLIYGPVTEEATSHLSETSYLENVIPGLPPYPQAKYPTIRDDMKDLNMVPLFACAEESVWDCPFMQDKIDIVKPEHIKKPTFADIIEAAALASGCNIVTEDFTSHKSSNYQNTGIILQLFKEKNSLTDTLSALKKDAELGNMAYTWFADEKSRLIVGWACDAAGVWNWRIHHVNLLPEDYLNGLKDKLDGSGLGLDDAIHCASLPKGAFYEWIFCSRDLSLSALTFIGAVDDPMWMLYDALQQEDKQQAMSSDGLPLAKFDTSWIAGFFRTYRLKQRVEGELPPLPNAKKADTTEKLSETYSGPDEMISAMSDPQVILTMVMRINQSVATTTYEPHKGLVKIPASLGLSRYDMVVSYTKDSKIQSKTIPGPALAFPITSPKNSK